MYSYLAVVQDASYYLRDLQLSNGIGSGTDAGIDTRFLTWIPQKNHWSNTKIWNLFSTLSVTVKLLKSGHIKLLLFQSFGSQSYVFIVLCLSVVTAAVLKVFLLCSGPETLFISELSFRSNWLRLEQLSVTGLCSAVPNSSHLLCVHCCLNFDLRRRSRDSYGSRPETQRALLFVSPLYVKLSFFHLLLFIHRFTPTFVCDSSPRKTFSLFHSSCTLLSPTFILILSFYLIFVCLPSLLCRFSFLSNSLYFYFPCLSFFLS